MSRRRLLPTTLAALLLAAPLLASAGPPAPGATAAAPATPATRPAPAAKPAAPAGPAVKQKAAHPATGADPATQDCAECHEEATPAAFKAWSGSRHGEAMVKCLVCHGDTGKSFTRAPPVARCAACHAAQVASAQANRPVKGPPQTCFSCHDHHALTVPAGHASPHTR